MAKRILDTASLSTNNILTRGDIRWKQIAHFEAGLLTPNPVGFDATAGVIANLAILKEAAILGLYGLRVTIAGVGSEAYGRLIESDNEIQVTVEFFLNPDDLTMGIGDNFRFLNAISFGPTGQGFALDMANPAGIIRINGQYRTDGGGNVFPWNYNLVGGIIKVRLEWSAASAPGANDGQYRIFVNDTLQAEITNGDTDQHAITEIQIGTISLLDAGTSGTIDFDNISWIDKFL